MREPQSRKVFENHIHQNETVSFGLGFIVLRGLFRTLIDLRGNIGANLYAQAVQLTTQLLSVPIFVLHWGLPAYGVWLVLFTIPAYLAVADLGLTTSAANEMIMAVARNDRDEALQTFQTLRLTVLATCIAALALFAVAILVVFPHRLSFAQHATGGLAGPTALALGAYGLLALQNGVALAGFRATGHYAFSGYVYITILLAENVCGLTMVLAGGKLFTTAITYLAVRLIGSLMLAVMLRHRARWITRMTLALQWRRLAKLAGPAAAVVAMPVAQALSLQGAVLVIGAACGTATVPIFTTVRTLTRTAAQMTFIVNLASMPVFTMASASGDERHADRLLLISMAISLIVLIPAVVIICLFGQSILTLWTHGTTVAPRLLLLVMALTMLLGGIWTPISNLILAVNRHAGFSYFYLGASIVALVAAYPLALHFGPTGVAFALLALDGAMLHRVVREGVRQGVVRPRVIRAACVAGFRLFKRPAED